MATRLTHYSWRKGRGDRGTKFAQGGLLGERPWGWESWTVGILKQWDFHIFIMAKSSEANIEVVSVYIEKTHLDSIKLMILMILLRAKREIIDCI